jgi:hypothetical protein
MVKIVGRPRLLEKGRVWDEALGRGLVLPVALS